MPGYAIFGVGLIFATVGQTGSNFWIPSYFQRSFHLDMAHISMMFGGIQLAGGVLGGWTGAYISDRRVRSDPGGHAKVSAVAFLLVAPLFAGVILAPTANLAFGFFFLATFAQSASYGPSAAAVQQFAPMALRGTASAILSVSVVAIGMGVGVPAIGVLSDLLGKTLGERALGSVLLILTIFYVLAAASIWHSAGKISADAHRRRMLPRPDMVEGSI
ncbi:MAG: MFS transporter [Verrucomicrobiaceae bacterium]|nr:MAG: MFS transporter [Verrucomicrobiaceae bacterium]